MIDYTELPQDGRAFEQLIREILLVYDLHPQWSGKGPDQGRDILATEKLEGPMGEAERTWLIQCKHFAHSGRSVGRADVGSVVDDCRQVGAEGYLLACSTHPSASLVTKLKELEVWAENRLATQVWDSVDIEKRLSGVRLFGLRHLFFPVSVSATRLQLYNAGSPNHWTAHYKDYFIHLSSRISGEQPALGDIEFLVGLLEQVDIDRDGEFIRPRALYFDDKHGSYIVFADYLVPSARSPSLRPSDFNEVLCDGDGWNLEEDFGWFAVYWDVRLCPISPFSDHFDKDHYRYYDGAVGDFRYGIARGAMIGSLAAGGDAWPAANG